MVGWEGATDAALSRRLRRLAGLLPGLAASGAGPQIADLRRAPQDRAAGVAADRCSMTRPTRATAASVPRRDPRAALRPPIPGPRGRRATSGRRRPARLRYRLPAPASSPRRLSVASRVIPWRQHPPLCRSISARLDQVLGRRGQPRLWIQAARWSPALELLRRGPDAAPLPAEPDSTVGGWLAPRSVITRRRDPRGDLTSRSGRWRRRRRVVAAAAPASGPSPDRLLLARNARRSPRRGCGRRARRSGRRPSIFGDCSRRPTRITQSGLRPAAAVSSTRASAARRRGQRRAERLVLGFDHQASVDRDRRHDPAAVGRQRRARRTPTVSATPAPTFAQRGLTLPTSGPLARRRVAAFGAMTWSVPISSPTCVP